MKGTAYLLQATLISLWWMGLLISQSFYDSFQFPGIGNDAFNAFMLPDLVIVGFLSIVRAYKDKKELDYVILGGFGFATLYCLNATLLTKGGYLSTVVMLLGLCYNVFLISEEKIFRKATTNSFIINATKTTFQIICVWLITLFVFPVLIVNSFGTITEVSNNTIIVAIALFVLFSIIGLHSAYVMVLFGQGTPLPLDQTQQLVTEGLYKYVRNPMAIAGVGQGVSVAILFWSIPVLVYTLIGAILWQLVVRPLEEKDMIERFGNDYLAYKRKVRCWIPKIN